MSQDFPPVKDPSWEAALVLLTEIAADLGSARGELDAAIERAIERIGLAVGADRAFVLSFSQNPPSFTMTHEWCAPGIHSQRGYFVNLPLMVFPWTARQLLAGKFVATERLEDYPPEADAERRICKDEGIKSIIFVPIVCGGEVIGSTGLDALRAPRPWTPPLIALLQAAGALFAANIAQRDSVRTLQRISWIERTKLGQDLHDSVAQDVAAAGLHAAALRLRLSESSPELCAMAVQVERQLRTARDGLRSLARGLCDLDGAGLPLTEALAELAAEITQRSGAEVRFANDGVPEIEDPESRTQLLWIAREAVHNALHHGRAKHVDILLHRHGEKACLSVTDDGAGLPKDFIQREGIGLKVMRHRAAVMGGQVTLAPNDPGGVRVRCVFPMHPFAG